MAPKRKAGDTGDDAPDAPDAPVNWSKLRVPELKAELEARGLPQTGLKKDLVARLEADDQGLPDPVLAAAPKKKSKKAALAEVSIPGPLASELIEFQDLNPETGEVRPRAFVPAPDPTYKAKYHKAHTERMFMLDRQRGFDRNGFPNETFDIAGSTGNIYQTTIGRDPRCVCMDARMRGQKCKHINYALIIILKAPSYLCYQQAFLSDEIVYIFANAPVTQAPDAVHQNHDHAHAHDDEGKRKPIEGDCPICVFEMEADEELVWCKAACGQNFHKACFDQWRASKRGARVTCVYCRTEWQEEGMAPSLQRPKPAPGSLASLKETAPKKGSYKNIGHLPMYQTERDEN